MDIIPSAYPPPTYLQRFPPTHHRHFAANKVPQYHVKEKPRLLLYLVSYSSIFATSDVLDARRNRASILHSFVYRLTLDQLRRVRTHERRFGKARQFLAVAYAMCWLGEMIIERSRCESEIMRNVRTWFLRRLLYLRFVIFSLRGSFSLIEE